MRMALRSSSVVMQNCIQPQPLWSCPRLPGSSVSTVNHATCRLPSHVNEPRWLCHHALAAPPNPEPSAATAGSMHARREPGPCMTPLLVTLRANLAVEFVDECERSLPCLRRVGEAASCRMRVGNVRRVENPQG